MLIMQEEKNILNVFFDKIPKHGDVLLLVSPLYWRRTSLLGLHVLQAACRQAGITAHVLYLNLLYSAIIDEKTHDKITDFFYLFGEHLFTASAFDRSGVSACVEKFLNFDWLPDFITKNSPGMANQQVPEMLAPFREWIGTVDWEQLEFLTTRWVQTTARQIADKGYRVVGCSTTYGGLVPAIALLNNIKRENSNVITVLGGALCEEEMVEGILSLEAGIDYIFSGEGELTFPDFIKKILAGHLPEGKIIYGETVTNLDIIPPPDYREYYDQIKNLSIEHRASEDFGFPYETSRGCWYGKCTFCSLKGRGNLYREKSPDKVLNDLKVLIKRHVNSTVFMTDTIIPHYFFDTLSPRISKEISPINIIYDTKSNLTLEQMLSLKKGGVVTLIPGIESLSPSLLRRMRKGVTVRENIAFLRYARSIKLTLGWHLIFGVPGDMVEEYEEMLRVLPLIYHLPPPLRVFPLITCRFSTYQRFPEAFGISNLRPFDIYKDIFPPHADLEKIAYYFTGEFNNQSYENPDIIIALAKEVQAWQKAWAAYEMVPMEIMLPTLHVTRKTKDEYVLEDTRGLPGKPRQMVLDRRQASTLLVAGPQESSADFQWAVDAQLGILMDSWYIPLATADPELLLEFERECRNSRKSV